MSFQLKNFNSIVISMLNNAKATQNAITDWNVGSAARTLIEAPAVEIEEFYQRMLYGILDAIPIAVYHAFGFDFAPAAAASGDVTLSFSQPIVNSFDIPAGSIFKNPSTNISYLTQADVVVPVGSTSVVLLVVADRVGTIGNAPANAITQVTGLYLPNTASILSAAIATGTDTESDLARMTRFSEFVGSLARGTPFAVMYAAKQASVLNGAGAVIEYVMQARMHEMPGTVDIYLHSSKGIPSADLLNAAQVLIDGRFDGVNYIAGYRPVGIRVRVLPMAERLINLPITVAASGDRSVLETEIKTVVELLFSAALPGTILTVPKITSIILGVTGVLSAVIDINTNIIITPFETVKVGNLQVTWG